SDQTQHYQSYDNHPQPPRHRRPRFPWFKTILVALIAGIIGALLVLGIGKVLNHTVLNKDGSSVQEVTNSKGGNQLDGKSDKYKS
ncbi:serine protease, partial [Staphylococcus haemolyticus]